MIVNLIDSSFLRWLRLRSWSDQCRMLVRVIDDVTFEARSTFPLSRYLYTLDKACVRAKSDQALEVIMTDLDPEIMKIFYQEYTSSAAEATKVRTRRTRSAEQTVRVV